ncbi:MAG: helix-turn-helix domain-containing protein [Polyangiales bacterium]
MRLPRVAIDLAAVPAWPPILATFGPGSASQGHAHHAMHLVVAKSGELNVRVGERSHRAPGVLTAPDVAHALDATGCEVLLVFVDPESQAGAKLAASITSSVRLIDEAERGAIFAAESESAMKWGEVAIAGLSGEQAERTVHPRVRKVLAHLRASPEDTSLEALAALAGLSESRLLHAFTESVGIPLRPYLLWLKLQRATIAIVTGEPLGRAAAMAGFSDAAHMTRTFRRMFGMAPSALRPR